MPDFHRLLMRKLRGLDRDVVEELAGHLRDCYEEQLHAGLSRRAAARAALRAVGDWKHLRSGVADARRGMMRDTTKRILIPGTAALLIATAGERLMWFMGAGTPHVYQYWSWLTATIPMLLVLLIAGATGAACSLRLGGNRRERLWASEFPALCALALFLMLLAGHQVSQIIRAQTTDWHAIEGALLRYLVFSIFIPAIVLLAGGLPFLLTRVKASKLESTAG